MPAPSASGFDLLCRNTTIATADRQQTNATTITALVVARMPKFIVGPQPVGTSRVFPQPARVIRLIQKWFLPNPRLRPSGRLERRARVGLFLKLRIETCLA